MIKFLFKLLTGQLFNLHLDGGGESAPAPAPTNQTVTQTNIPEYARPYVEGLLGRAQSLTTTDPYQSYAGPRVADFTSLQNQSFDRVGNMQVAPQVGQATGIAGLGGVRAFDLSNYAMGIQPGYQAMATDPGAMQSWMSPYMQNAVDVQKQQAVRDYGRQLPQLGSTLAKAGAFGGSRHAIMESEAQRNLMNQLAGIQATGTQQAFQNAQQAQQFNANLGIQGLQNALQGTNLGLQSANTLGQLGQTQFGQNAGIAEAQQKAGAQQQALQQQRYDIAHQDFLNQVNYPYRQIGFMSDVVRGMPLTQQSQSVYQAPPSSANQMMAYGLGAYGLSNLFGGGKKKGGTVKAKRGGRVVDGKVTKKSTTPMGGGLAKLALDRAMKG